MTSKQRHIIIGLIMLAVVIGAGCALYSFTHRASAPARQTSSNGTAITVTGTVTCLTHKDTSGPVDLMCAIGLAGDNGKNYALSSDDPSTTGSIPTGQKATVTGTFKEQSSQYDSVGIINVQSIKRQ